jgi:hypothetical protein
MTDVRAVACLFCGKRFYPEDYESLARFRAMADRHADKLGHEIGWPGEQDDDW